MSIDEIEKALGDDLDDAVRVLQCMDYNEPERYFALGGLGLTMHEISRIVMRLYEFGLMTKKPDDE